MKDFDTLIISGGSTKGILTLGALQYLYNTINIEKIHNYIGTSAGSIICFLLIIGYKPDEIITYICTKQLLENMGSIDILSMFNGGGAMLFTKIYECLEKMTIDKIGYLPTLQNLKDKYNKNLVCSTYNLTTDNIEYLSVYTYPEMPCLIALRMSSNLPFLFEKFKYNNNFYIDGGIHDNFPIDINEELTKKLEINKVIGLLISKEIYNIKDNTEQSSLTLLEYIYRIMFIPIDQTIEYKIKNVLTNKNIEYKIIRLFYDKLKFFHFKLSTKEKLDIFSLGYTQAKEQFII